MFACFIPSLFGEVADGLTRPILKGTLSAFVGSDTVSSMQVSEPMDFASWITLLDFFYTKKFKTSFSSSVLGSIWAYWAFERLLGG